MDTIGVIGTSASMYHGTEKILFAGATIFSLLDLVYLISDSR